MTEEQAIEELLFQSGVHSDIENPRWQKGFLGMLRPFQGELYEENYHKIVKSLKVLMNKIQQENVSKEIIHSIFAICHLGRAWGLEPQGMLRSNNLINDEQIKLLEKWINNISYITFCILDGCDEVVAFEVYDDGDYNILTGE